MIMAGLLDRGVLPLHPDVAMSEELYAGSFTNSRHGGGRFRALPPTGVLQIAAKLSIADRL